MSTRPHPRAKLKWQVAVKTAERSIDGVTLDLNPNYVFVSCPKPLRLNETFDIAITDPDSGRCIKAKAEVVWSNIYGPDDEITPRGMGGLFLNISGEDRTFISKAVREQLTTDEAEVGKEQALKTLVLDPGQMNSEAA